MFARSRKPAPLTPQPAATPVAVDGAPHVEEASDNPTQWGRVDPDGTVYLTAGLGETGERVIGQWQAGDPSEGLAHYAQRFDDLRTEVMVLADRLTTHPENATAIAHQAADIRTKLPEMAVIGDVSAVDTLLGFIIGSADAAHEKAKEARAEARATAIARKEELAAEAEQIGKEATNWKEAGERLRAILEEWKTIRGIDRKTDDALWKRYARGRDAFTRRRGSHFAQLDRDRASARTKKEELVARAEALQDSTDWSETAATYRDLMKEWKQAGRAPRETDDKLWARFRAAQDVFFGHRDDVNRQRDEEFEANAEAKQRLLDEYGPLIDPAKNLESARHKLHELQDKWEQIGFVPRKRMKEFDHKLQEIESRVANAADDLWRRSDPAAKARADQFVERAAELLRQAAAAEERGQQAQAEDLRAQAAQWSQWAQAAERAIENL